MTNPSDKAQAQEFREWANESGLVGVSLGGRIDRRARELDATPPAQAVEAVDAARWQTYERELPMSAATVRTFVDAVIARDTRAAIAAMQAGD